MRALDPLLADTIDARFSRAVALFCTRQGMSARAFGMAALNDPGFVAALAQGRSPRLSTVDRALAFMGERLGEVASVAVFLRWQDLGEAAALLVLMIFVAVGGLIFGCAAAIVPEGSPVLLARWRYFQRRFTCLGHLTSQATLPGSGWREFAGRCLVYGSVAAALLPVVVVHVLLTSVDAARLAA